MPSFSFSRFTRFALLIIWFGSLLRLWQIGVPRVWYDEITTIWAGSLPFGRMLAVTAGDVHPPAYYALVWLVEHVTGSDSAWLLRLPSAILSIAAMPLLVVVGRRLKLSDNAILLGLAFMAVSTMQIYFAQEIRMYALLQVEVLLAIIFMLDRKWFQLSLSSAAMLYTHNYGFIYCAVIYGIAVVREMKQPIKVSPGLDEKVIDGHRLIASGVAALILYRPWLPALQKQMALLGNWWQLPTTPGGFLDPFYAFWFGGGSLPGGLMLLGELLAYGLTLIAIVKGIQVRRFIMLALAFAPMLLSVTIEAVTHNPTYLYRSFIGSSGIVFLMAGAALTEIRKPLAAVALAGLAPVAAIGVIVFYPYMQIFKAPSNFYPEIDYQAGDIIYHMNSGSVIDAYAYSRAPEWHSFVHPAFAGDKGTLTDETLSALGVGIAPLESITWHRAWVLYATGPTLGSGEDLEIYRLTQTYDSQLIARTEPYGSKAYKGELWLLTR